MTRRSNIAAVQTRRGNSSVLKNSARDDARTAKPGCDHAEVTADGIGPKMSSVSLWCITDFDSTRTQSSPACVTAKSRGSKIRLKRRRFWLALSSTRASYGDSERFANAKALSEPMTDAECPHFRGTASTLRAPSILSLLSIRREANLEASPQAQPSTSGPSCNHWNDKQTRRPSRCRRSVCDELRGVYRRSALSPARATKNMFKCHWYTSTRSVGEFVSSFSLENEGAAVVGKAVRGVAAKCSEASKTPFLWRFANGRAVTQ